MPRSAHLVVAAALTGAALAAPAIATDLRHDTSGDGASHDSVAQPVTRDQPAGASADEGEAPPPAFGPPIGKLSVSLESGAAYSGASDLDGSGDLSVVRVSSSITLATRVSDTVALSFTLGQNRNFYDFDNAAGLILTAPTVADPLSEGQSVSFSPAVFINRPDGWGGFVLLSNTFSGEPGAVFDDSYTIGGVVGITKKINAKLTLGGGIATGTRLRGGATLVPFPVVEWAIDDRWSLSVGRSRSGGGLYYKANDNLTLSVEGGFTRGEYRLDSDNPVPGGILIERAIPVEFVADWRVTDRVRLSGRVGVEVGGEIEIFNAADARLTEIDRDPAPTVGFELGIRF